MITKKSLKLNWNHLISRSKSSPITVWVDCLCIHVYNSKSYKSWVYEISIMKDGYDTCIFSYPEDVNSFGKLTKLQAQYFAEQQLRTWIRKVGWESGLNLGEILKDDE